MRRITVLTLAVMTLASLAAAAGSEGKPQTTCPVMGNPINKDVFVDHAGSRIYFCCPACVEKFNKDPEKYMAKLEADGVTPEKAPIQQTVCPVTGKPINKDVFVDFAGSRVYFCCPACVSKFTEDPEQYMKKMAADGVVLEDTPVVQTMCPVTGEPINKASFTDYNGRRVYFCCDNCKAKFEKNPEEYLDKLEGEAALPHKSGCSPATRGGCAGMVGCGRKA